MNAQEILDEIRMLGGSLEARGDRLHVEAPKGALKPAHRGALAALKLELLALLQQKRGGRELEASRRRLESAGVSIAVWEDGSMRVLVSEADTLGAIKDGGTIYSPADMWWHCVRLKPDERRMLHEFKKRFGGTTEWRDGE